MSQASKMFLLMREEEAASLEGFGQMTKTKISENANAIVQQVLDGDLNPIKVKIACKTMIEYFTQVDKGVAEAAFTEASTYGKEKVDMLNSTFETKNGARRYDFKVDATWNELNRRLKRREELLKMATNSSAAIFEGEEDEDPGVEVPKVPMTFDKDAIVITIKK